MIFISSFSFVLNTSLFEYPAYLILSKASDAFDINSLKNMFFKQKLIN